MRFVKSLMTAGLMALLVGGGVALPAQDAEAYTRCRDVYTNGVHKRICTTRGYDRPRYRDDDRPRYRGDYRPRHRTVCRTSWRGGERYRVCRSVRVSRW